MVPILSYSTHGGGPLVSRTTIMAKVQTLLSNLTLSGKPLIAFCVQFVLNMIHSHLYVTASLKLVKEKIGLVIIAVTGGMLNLWIQLTEFKIPETISEGDHDTISYHIQCY